MPPRPPAPRLVEYERFDGGLNLRDAAEQLGPNETPYCLNVQFDDRGDVVKRLGLTKDTGMSAFATPILAAFYSHVLGKIVVQVGAKLYTRDSAGTYTQVTRSGPADAFSSSAVVSFCDFAGKLCVVHPADGVLTYTGSGNISVASATPKGVTIAAWQNRLWVGGNPSAGNTLYFSAQGDPASWPNSIVVREVNDQPITCIVAGERTGLLVTKEDVTHRVFDQATGNYETISPELGCVGPRAAVSFEGVVYMLTKRGIAVTDMGGVAIVSDKIEPLFHADQLELSLRAQACAGIVEDRVLFSLARSGASANDLTIEYDPHPQGEDATGWFAPHTFGARAFVTLAGGDRTLFHAHPTNGLLYRTFKGGTDDGTAFSGIWQSAWLAVGGKIEGEFHRARLTGRGSVTLKWGFDWTRVLTGIDFSMDPLQDFEKWGLVADGGTGPRWGSFRWGAPPTDRTEDLWNPGRGKVVAFRIEDALTAVYPRVDLLGRTGGDAGSWSLSSIRLEYVPLGQA